MYNYIGSYSGGPIFGVFKNDVIRADFKGASGIRTNNLYEGTSADGGNLTSNLFYPLCTNVYTIYPWCIHMYTKCPVRRNLNPVLFVRV